MGPFIKEKKMAKAFSSLYSLFLLDWANEQVYRNENVAFNHLTTC